MTDLAATRAWSAEAPGPWIETDPSGLAVVLALEGDLLAVFFRHGVVCIVAPGFGDVGPVNAPAHGGGDLHEEEVRTPVPS